MHVAKETTGYLLNFYVVGSFRAGKVFPRIKRKGFTTPHDAIESNGNDDDAESTDYVFRIITNVANETSGLIILLSSYWLFDQTSFTYLLNKIAVVHKHE